VDIMLLMKNEVYNAVTL